MLLIQPHIAFFTRAQYKALSTPQSTYKSELHWLKKLKAQIFHEAPSLTDLSAAANRWGNLKHTSVIMTRPLERIGAVSQTGLEVSAPPSGSSLALTDQTQAEAGYRDQFSLRAKGLHSEGPKLPGLGLCRPVSQINHHQEGLGHQAAI